MGERLSGLILWGLVLWTVLGLAGILVARRRHEHARFVRGARTLGAVWLGYMVLLLGVSWRQVGRVYRPGEERCFGSLCFKLREVEELPGFLVRGEERERLLRVQIAVTNRNHEKTESEPGLTLYLEDERGHRYQQLAGLGGVRLTSALAAGSSTVSEPVFKVAKDATGLRLVLLHEGWTAARLKVGDPESLFHRPATMLFP